MSEAVYFEEVKIVDPDREDHIQKKISTVLADNTKSFFVEYCVKERCFRIDPSYRKYIRYNLSGREQIDVTKLVFRPDLPAVHDFFATGTKEESTIQTEDFRIYTDEFSYEWFRITRIPGEDEGDVILIFSNIEKEMQEKDKLKLLDTQDGITYLPNFEVFLAQTSAMIQENPRRDYALIHLDIDRFKMINQLYGREEGNHVLRYIAVKIQERVEAEGDGTYCHMAFDIFGICIQNDEVKIHSIIKYLQTELEKYPLVFQLILSFGIYIYGEKDREEHTKVEVAMSRALTAQRIVKGNYSKHIEFYNESLRKNELAEQFIVSEMNKAVEQQEFKLFLQPKCNMRTGEIVGSEALVRWMHPEKGMISPAEFIPVFENNGFITVLDKYMIEMTCKTIRRWLDDGTKAYPVSVNVSRIDLYAKNIVKFIKKCVKQYQIPHGLIEFELTESAFVADSVALSDLMTELQFQKFKILMDDFGSGYSSLNTLKDIAVDILKIDLKFLPITKEETRANIILEAVVEMAERLGMEVVVEGVETLVQAELLCSIGCEIAQGFYYYRPMPEEQFEQELKNIK